MTEDVELRVRELRQAVEIADISGAQQLKEAATRAATAMELALTISQEQLEEAAKALAVRDEQWWDRLSASTQDVYKGLARAAFTAAGFKVEE